MIDTLTRSNFFLDYSNYYDLLYQDKDYLAETKYVANLLNTYAPNTIELLELGCGTGNYSKHLTESGYKITGIEKSSQMVELANAKSIPGFLSVHDDIVTFEINKKFDAAVSLFHVIGYLNENEDLLTCLKQVSKHLKEKGLFIFDVWYTAAVYSKQPKNKIKRINTSCLEITRISEPQIVYEKNVVQVNYQMFIKNLKTLQNEVLTETHSMRHFSTPEIKLMAKLSGFSVIRSEEFLTAKEPSEDTWGVCYILQKND